MARIDEHWPRWRGTVRIILRDKRGRFLPGSGKTFDNLIVNAGLNLLAQGLYTPGGFDTSIYYLAIGTSSTAPAAGDTQLGAEVFRKAVTTQVAGGSAGQAVTTVYISPSDTPGTVIAELGWFAGASAGPSANSGVLIAHVLYSHTHTALESIQIQRTDTL